jgi:hypothetical protein
MAVEQNRCLEPQRLLGGTSLKLTFRQTGAQCLAGDVSTGNFRPIVPLKFRKNIFDHFHNVAHPGRLASHRIISSRFVWCDLSSDVTGWAHGCLACQRGKIHCHTRLVPQPIPIPQWCVSHLHVDLVGPLPYSNNFNHIFTIIDCTSKWMEAIPFSETSVAACTKALTFTRISRFGVLETITSDRGLQFNSNLWLQLCGMLNISHKQTTAYHPELNGAVKRLQRRLKDTLRASVTAVTWSEELPFVLLGLRAQPREDTDLSPAEAVFGAQIVLPNEFLQNDEFQLTPLSKNFPKPCMFLLLLCLDTILAPICPASCQLSCSPPPSSGSIGAAWFHPFSRSTTAPTQSGAVAPAPSPSELGRGTRWSPSAASRLAWPRTPCLAARITVADRWVCTQAVLPQPSGSRFQSSWFLHLLFWRCNKTVLEPFSYPARRFLHA